MLTEDDYPMLIEALRRSGEANSFNRHAALILCPTSTKILAKSRIPYPEIELDPTVELLLRLGHSRGARLVCNYVPDSTVAKMLVFSTIRYIYIMQDYYLQDQDINPAGIELLKSKGRTVIFSYHHM